ncbi:MAG: hypothetical protein M0R17_00750 [Candidatus Omnitrophica bacterium]|jgi:hypothetical protein|nr:hypothetical protein [Candidatus Omnitrophota bacterium]
MILLIFWILLICINAEFIKITIIEYKKDHSIDYDNICMIIFADTIVLATTIAART